MRERAEAPGMNLIDESLDPGRAAASRLAPQVAHLGHYSDRTIDPLGNTHQTTRYFMIKPAEDGRPS